MNKLVLVSILLLGLFLWSGEASSLFTNELSVSSANVCGNYSQALVVSAAGILNKENATLASVTARLNLSNAMGLHFITAKEVALGSISALSNSSVNPQWTLECNGNSSGERALFVEYALSTSSSSSGSSEFFSENSFNETKTVVTVHPSVQKDTAPPRILKHEPTASLRDTSTKVVVVTDEDAECRYSSAMNTPFEGMASSFNKISSTTFEKLMTGLAEGSNILFVRCKDASGNVNVEDYKLTLNVDFLPTAKISLSDPSPVKPGVVTVTLTTSEDMLVNPVLKYVLGEGAPVAVPLSGKGKLWTGYIVISADSNQKIGSFSFSGKDLSGSEGAIITEGNMFLVEIAGLNPPLLVDAISGAGKDIQVKWYYTNPSAKSFNIYRFTKTGVSYLNYYKNLPNTLPHIKSFADTEVTSGTTYYYAVSVVDETGDEGLLSPEAWAMAGSEVKPANGEAAALEGAIPAADLEKAGEAAGADGKINSSALTDKISSLLDKIDDRKTFFKEQKSALAEKTGVQEMLKDQRTELLKIRNDAAELYDKPATAEYTEKFKNFEEKIKAIEQNIPEDVAEGDQQQSLPKQEISLMNLNESLSALEREKKKTLSDEQKKVVLKELASRQKEFEVKGTEEYYVISFLDKRKEFASLITKKITPLKPVLSSSTIIELLPSAVNASRDVFLIKSVKLLASGNGLISEINEWKNVELTFLVRSKEKPISAWEGKMIVFPFSLAQMEKKSSGNALTGWTVANLNPASWEVETLVIVLSVPLLAGSGIYYVRLNRRATKRNGHSSSSHAHPQSQLGEHHAHSSRGLSINSLFPFIGRKKENRYALDTRVDNLESFNNQHNNSHFPGLPANYPPTAYSTLNASAATNEPVRRSSPLAFPHHSPHAAEEYSKAGLSSLADISGQYLLLRLEEYLNQMDYDAAIKCHHQILLNQKTALKEKHEQQLMEKLEKKLEILARVQQLQSCFEQYDLLSIRDLLNEISQLYNSILAPKISSSEAEFALRVKEVYNRYAQEVVRVFSVKKN